MTEQCTGGINKIIYRSGVTHYCTLGKHGVGCCGGKVNLLHALSGMEDKLNPQKTLRTVADKIDRQAVAQPDALRKRSVTG
jgi:hypothetical protein